MLQQRSRASVRATRARNQFIRVDLRQVRLSLDGRSVLRGIDWSIRPGQRWWLKGPNGAGKTLLLKLIAGDLWPQPGGGQRCYFYRRQRFDTPYAIKQEIAYLGAERQDRYERYGWDFSVEQVIGTGLYRTDIPLDVLSARDRHRIAVLLRRLDLHTLADRRFLTLSYGERRLVLLARALMAAPKLLLLDELFNGLDQINRERALRCLTQISQTKLPWVLSSHRDEEVPAIMTHCCELQAGRVVAQGRLPRRRPKSLEQRPTRVAAGARAVAGGGLLVRVKDATVWREGAAALRALSLELRAGQSWIVHGANGSGKSSFIQMLYGDLPVASGGSIERAGIVSGVPIARFKRRVGLIAPELQAMHPRDVGVDETVAAGLDASIAQGGASPSRSRKVKRALRRVGATALQWRTLRTLSYGQLRGVLFARALMRTPDILLLDEPFTGLDVVTRARLRALVQREIESGVTVVLATHHIDDWPRGVTHELELAAGQTLYCGPLRAQAQPRGHRRG